MSEEQELNLWRSGAAVYAAEGYDQYRISFRKAKEDLIKEQARWGLFQDYRVVQSEFKAVLQSGAALQEKVSQQKQILQEDISHQASSLKGRIVTLKGITAAANEGRLARKDLMRAELLLSEATSRLASGDYRAAEAKLKDSSGYLKTAEDALLPVLNRFADSSRLKKWRQLADKTIAESKNKGIKAIVVNKSEHLLVLYNNGVPLKTYSIGLGRNGYFDKLHAGDNSTPEGSYRIIKKNPQSRYHKALLINYPNDEDRTNYRRAKRKGLIPAGTGIGGLIEIHGGGKDSMTYGCVGMDNESIDDLFSLVDVGTPVTIVGAVDDNNRLSTAIKGL